VKPSRSANPRKADVGIIRRGGRIALPPDWSIFKLGQRVYFHWNGRKVAFASKPTRAIRGRLISRRIRTGYGRQSSMVRAHSFAIDGRQWPSPEGIAPFGPSQTEQPC
jgi:hypothetical protein